jgi:hypothetical protein
MVGEGGYWSLGESPSHEDLPDAPPPGYIGGLLSEQPVLLRRPNLVAYLTKVRAYPTGVLFQVAIEERQADVLERVMDGDEDVDVAVTVDGSEDRPDVDQLGSEASSGEDGASWLAEYWVSRAPGVGHFIVDVTIGDLAGSASLPGALLQSAAAGAIDFFEHER